MIVKKGGNESGGPKRVSSKRALKSGRRGLLDLRSFRQIFPSNESKEAHHKRRQELVDLYIEEATPNDPAATLAVPPPIRRKRSLSNEKKQGDSSGVNGQNQANEITLSACRRRSSSQGTTKQSTENIDLNASTSSTSKLGFCSIILSHVSDSSNNSLNLGITPASRCSGGGSRSLGGSIGTSSLPGGRKFNLNVMEAAFDDVRTAANQLEDQLTRALEAQANPSTGQISLAVVREILRQNHFNVDDDGELGLITERLGHHDSQQPLHANDNKNNGEEDKALSPAAAEGVVDFYSFLNAVRPRIWSELMTRQMGHYQGTQASASDHRYPATAQRSHSLDLDYSAPTPVSAGGGGKGMMAPSQQLSSTNAAAANFQLPPLRLDNFTGLKDSIKRDAHKDIIRRATPHCLASGSRTTLLELRKELAMAEYGVKVLQERLVEDVVWVNEHCGTKSKRARHVCERFGAEKMAIAINRIHLRLLQRRFLIWKDFYHFALGQDCARQYLRLKACHLLAHTLTRWLHREYRKAIVLFKAELIRQRTVERQDAAVTIQRHARGFKQRAITVKKHQAKAAVVIQSATRQALARQKRARLHVAKKRNESAVIIQKQFKKHRASKPSITIVSKEEERKEGDATTTAVNGSSIEIPEQDEHSKPTSAGARRDNNNESHAATKDKLKKDCTGGNSRRSTHSTFHDLPANAPALSEEELCKQEEEKQKRLKLEKEKRDQMAEQARLRRLEKQNAKDEAKRKAEKAKIAKEKEEKAHKEKARKKAKAAAAAYRERRESELAAAVALEEEQAAAKPGSADADGKRPSSLVGVQGHVPKASNEEQRKIQFAARIESLSRGRTARRALQESHRKKVPASPVSKSEDHHGEKERKAQAATRIQSLSRGMIARKRVEGKLRSSIQQRTAFVLQVQGAAYEEEEIKRAQAAAKIQAIGRGRMARKAVQQSSRRQSSKADDLEFQIIEEEGAVANDNNEEDEGTKKAVTAARIQSITRGRLARKTLQDKGRTTQLPQPIPQPTQLSSQGQEEQQSHHHHDEALGREGNDIIEREKAGVRKKSIAAANPPPSAATSPSSPKAKSPFHLPPQSPIVKAATHPRRKSNATVVMISQPTEEEKQRAEAALRIQALSRGGLARKKAAAVQSQQTDYIKKPPSPMQPKSPTMKTQQQQPSHPKVRTEDDMTQAEAAASSQSVSRGKLSSPVSIPKPKQTATATTQTDFDPPPTSASQQLSRIESKRPPSLKVVEEQQTTSPIEVLSTTSAATVSGSPSLVVAAKEKKNAPSPSPSSSSAAKPVGILDKLSAFLSPNYAGRASSPPPNRGLGFLNAFSPKGHFTSTVIDTSNNAQSPLSAGLFSFFSPKASPSYHGPELNSPVASPSNLEGKASKSIFSFWPTTSPIAPPSLKARNIIQPQVIPLVKPDHPSITTTTSDTNTTTTIAPPQTSSPSTAAAAPMSPSTASASSKSLPQEAPYSQKPTLSITTTNDTTTSTTTAPQQTSSPASSAASASSKLFLQDTQPQEGPHLTKRSLAPPRSNIPTPKARSSQVSGQQHQQQEETKKKEEEDEVEQQQQVITSKSASMKDLAPVHIFQPVVVPSPVLVPVPVASPSTAAATKPIASPTTLIAAATTVAAPTPSIPPSPGVLSPKSLGSTLFGFMSPKSKRAEDEAFAALSPEDQIIRLKKLELEKKAKAEAEVKRKEAEEEEKKRKAEEEKQRKVDEKKAKERQVEEVRKAKKAKEAEEKRLKREKEMAEKAEFMKKKRAEEEERKKIEAEERVAKKVLKANQMKAALRVQKVFRGFRVRKRMPYKRAALRELERRVAEIVVKACIRIQSMVRGKLQRKHFASHIHTLMRRRDEIKRKLQERIIKETAEKKAREEEAARQEALQALLASQKEKAKKEGEGVSSSISLEMQLRLNKFMAMEELEKQLQEREASLREAEAKLKEDRLQQEQQQLVLVEAQSSLSSQSKEGGEGGSQQQLVPFEQTRPESDWIEYWDDAAQAYYYYSSVTQEASWEAPPNFMSAAMVAAGSQDSSQYDGSTTSSTLEEGWIEQWEETNKQQYWINMETGEASWTRPTQGGGGDDASQASSNSVVTIPPYQQNPEEWVAYLDENSGEEYWVNTNTGQTIWS